MVWLERRLQDVRYVALMLRQSPGFMMVTRIRSL